MFYSTEHKQRQMSEIKQTSTLREVWKFINGSKWLSGSAEILVFHMSSVFRRTKTFIWVWNSLKNCVQEYQTDLEVILEFLEEHYRQESCRKALWNMRDLSVISTSDGVDNSGEKLPDEEDFLSVSEQETQGIESFPKANGSDCEMNCSVDHLSVHQNTSDGQGLNALNTPESPSTLHATPEKCADSLASTTPAEKGKKLRLFHFLYEMLEDPNMVHCVTWVPASAGVFRFSAKHKEHVAELWGQRKGNRMPMTYQKMSRALRNYSRSGEIIKVKKKLTYQFSVATLSTLQSQCVKKAACGSK